MYSFTRKVGRGMEEHLIQIGTTKVGSQDLRKYLREEK